MRADNAHEIFGIDTNVFAALHYGANNAYAVRQSFG